MALIFDVKVVPSSGRNKWVLDASGKLKCYLKSPPQKGLANKELVRLVSKVLGVSRLDIAITSGLTSRKKRIKVNTQVSFDAFLGLLGIEKQKKLFS